ncbi:MAG: polyphosphate kinase 2 family protein [Proteobacteria bacterium]|nr:polyphosphate kinase 2 family protein [Pseudomonadota bacterium]
MASFKPYRVPTRDSGKFKLSKLDPGATPFSQGSEEKQREELDELALELDRLQNRLHAEGRRKLLLVLQGMDTSGKDGTIRWVFSRTSPLGVRVQPFKAPSELERSHDYLWRCHAVVPAAGQLMVWNRSHYEDVLVPVVEELIDKKERLRRYGHINDFERLLTDTGTTIIKCMLHISKDEQRARLQDRIDTPSKQWKFQRADLDVREKWDAYQAAYERALSATSTAHAPWHVIPSDSKTHRNLMIASLLIKTLQGMELRTPPADPALKGLVVC